MRNLKEICDKVNMINILVMEVNKLCSKDLFRNYKWREFINCKNIQCIDPSYELDLSSNTGHDFFNSRTKDGEDKSSNGVKLYKKLEL